MKNHQIKTHSEYFQQVWDRKKLFEIRKDDRNYEVGDTLTLLDYNPETNTYNRRTISAEISYKLNGGNFGIENGFCALSMSKLANWNLDEEGLPHFCS